MGAVAWSFSSEFFAGMLLALPIDYLGLNGSCCSLAWPSSWLSSPTWTQWLVFHSSARLLPSVTALSFGFCPLPKAGRPAYHTTYRRQNQGLKELGMFWLQLRWLLLHSEVTMLSLRFRWLFISFNSSLDPSSFSASFQCKIAYDVGNNAFESKTSIKGIHVESSDCFMSHNSCLFVSLGNSGILGFWKLLWKHGKQHLPQFYFSKG